MATIKDIKAAVELVKTAPLFSKQAAAEKAFNLLVSYLITLEVKIMELEGALNGNAMELEGALNGNAGK
jgi:hypothetical protein